MIIATNCIDILFDLFNVSSLHLYESGFLEVGGYTNVASQYFNSPPEVTRLHLEGDRSNTTNTYWECGLVPENSLRLFKPHDDPNLPWTGITFGLTVSAIWYWCTDQVNVRVFH